MEGKESLSHTPTGSADFTFVILQTPGVLPSFSLVSTCSDKGAAERQRSRSDMACPPPHPLLRVATLYWRFSCVRKLGLRQGMLITGVDGQDVTATKIPKMSKC